MVELRQTETFDRWFRKLRDSRARARIQVRIDRLMPSLPATQSQWAKGFPNFVSTMAPDIACTSCGVAKC